MGIGNRTWKLGGKALLVAAPIAIGLHVSGLPARDVQHPEPRVSHVPAPKAPVQKALLSAPAPTRVDANADYVVKRVLKINGPFRHGDYVWNDAGVPEGPVVITVDIAAQTLSVFRAGYEIGAAVILYGGDEKPTPLGVFPITQKDADHHSSLYDAPMPYMLRLTNDGVSIHGTSVKYGFATHGCIGIPTPFAKRLFDQVKLGDKVIVTNGEMLSQGEAITAI